MDGIIGFAIGVLVAAATSVIAWVVLHGRQRSRTLAAESRAGLLEEQLESQRAEIETARAAVAEADARREAAERRVAVLETEAASSERRLDEEKSIREEMEKRLTDTFEALGARALRANRQQFLDAAGEQFKRVLEQFKGDDARSREALETMLKPIRELMDRQNTKLTELDKRWTGEKSGIEEKLRMIAQAHHELTDETGRLVKALRRPEQRGRWGELQLQNVVELAGMREHCDFSTQVMTDDPDTRDRPDMIVNLPGGGVIVVDSKIALDAYLESVESEDDSARAECLSRHTQQVETHIRRLANKKYWNQFERTPKAVVMFVSVESALMAALDRKPDLHAQAMESHVLIATPTLLVALLRAVAYGWQQEAVAENARDIARVGQELYGRLSKFVGDMDSLGQRLAQATRAYNEAIGSFERRLLPSARKLKDLGVSTIDDVESPPQVELEIRPLFAAELRDGDDEDDANAETPLPRKVAG